MSETEGLEVPADVQVSPEPVIQIAEDEVKTPKSSIVLEAEKILNTPIPLITEKKITPPSGDKRDFVSLAPYFWLVEGNLEQRDGEVNPAIEDYTDPEKFAQVASNIYLTSLAADLVESQPDKEKFADCAVSTLKAWFVDEDTRMTPSLEYAQMRQGEASGNWYGIIEGQRLVYVMEGISSLKEAGLIDQETIVGIEGWFRQYSSWLRDSEKGKLTKNEALNNHRTFYDVQVAYIADSLGETDLARETIEEAKGLIANQIEPDGRMPLEAERAIPYDYQLYNLYAFSLLANLGQKYSVDLWNWQAENGGSLKKAFGYFSKQLEGAGDNPFKMDRAGELYLAFRAAAKAYGDASYENLPKRFYENSLADEISTQKFREK